VILLLLFYSSFSFAKGSEVKNFQLIFTDNTAATGGPNDMAQTGDLEFSYTHPEKHYKISIKEEIFVNTFPGDNNVTRENPNNIRADILSLYFIQGEAFKYGLGVEVVGHLGGATVQNFLHKVSGNPHIPAQYYTRNKVTPTFNFQYYASVFNDNFDFYSTGKLALNAEYGLTTFDAMLRYTKYNVKEWPVDAALALGFDCTKYPNNIAFKGHPIVDYQVCTPQSKFSLQYKDFNFFWKIPLMNNQVQNSILGISYVF